MVQMAKRNTIQRQLVIAAVRFLADHPTAEEVYDRITMEYPDISKGTVYRNLKEMVANGDAVAAFNTSAAEQTATMHIAANDPTYAGRYEDIVTFTIAVKSDRS